MDLWNIGVISGAVLMNLAWDKLAARNSVTRAIERDYTSRRRRETVENICYRAGRRWSGRESEPVHKSTGFRPIDHIG